VGSIPVGAPRMLLWKKIICLAEWIFPRIVDAATSHDFIVRKNIPSELACSLKLQKGARFKKIDDQLQS
jgi:hypothetical protein